MFGQVIRGQDVVERIAEQRKNAADRPLKDIKMTVTVKEGEGGEFGEGIWV